MSKLTKSDLRVLKQALKSMLHLECIIHRREIDCEFLQNRFKYKHIEYYKGMREAQYQWIESTLHATNLYQGYGEWKFKGQVGKETPYRKYFGNQLHDLYKQVVYEEYTHGETVGGVMENVNGFIFNAVGELVGKPDSYDISLLQATYYILTGRGQYISASRINHLVQVLQTA